MKRNRLETDKFEYSANRLKNCDEYKQLETLTHSSIFFGENNQIRFEIIKGVAIEKILFCHSSGVKPDKHLNFLNLFNKFMRLVKVYRIINLFI